MNAMIRDLIVVCLLLGAVVGWQYRDQPLPRRVLRPAQGIHH